jgi:hypothetical protein
MFLVDVLSSRLTRFPEPCAGHASCRDINRCAPLRYRRLYARTISRWRLRVLHLLKSAACTLQTLQQAAALSYPLSSRTWDRAARQPEGFRASCVSRSL